MASRKAAAALSSLEMDNNRQVALGTYRFLLRAINLAFKGDQRTYSAAASLARSNFRDNSGLESGSIEALKQIEHAQGVARILRENVVQGKNVGGEKYRLNIHEHTQRGSNDTAKELKGTTKSFKEIKGAQF